jgi:AcrR family transcriptional regulator
MSDGLTPSTSSPTAGGSPPPGADEAASTHERLLAVATALFAERGYGGTSMADIADGVGVRKASLYNYYPSKQEILMEILRRAMSAGHDACVGELEGDGPFDERLWRHFRAGVRFAVEHPDLVAIFRVAATQIGGELGERAMSEVHEWRAVYRRRLQAAFARAVEDGDVRPAEPADLSYAFRMFVNGVVTGHLAARGGAKKLSEERLKRIWKLFWNGIGNEERE